MPQLTELNKISIVYIVFYSPALIIAIILAARHGFKRASGWLYLILFSLIKIIGASLDLATIASPGNVGLISGTNALSSAGLSPLILVSVGLLTRVLTGLNVKTSTILQPRVLQLIQLAVMIGLILTIVGGLSLGDQIGNITSHQPVDLAALQALQTPTETRAGIALMIAGFSGLALSTAMLSLQLRSVERGERRLIGAVAAALPFILVRVIYAAIGAYHPSDPNFRYFTAGPNYYPYLIGMSVVMEMCAVIILEAVGLTLRKSPGDGYDAPEESAQELKQQRRHHRQGSQREDRQRRDSHRRENQQHY